MPSAKTLSNIAAEKIVKAVNESDKKDVIAKYSQYAQEINEISIMLTNWGKNGVLDSKEQEEISKQLEPLFKKMIDLI